MQHLRALAYVLQTKDLEKFVSPLDATLTKNRGRGPHDHVSTPLPRWPELANSKIPIRSGRPGRLFPRPLQLSIEGPAPFRNADSDPVGTLGCQPPPCLSSTDHGTRITGHVPFFPCGCPVFHLPYALPSSVSRKPIVCHSYENCRGVYQQFPSWNEVQSPSTSSACSSTGHGTRITSHVPCSFFLTSLPLSYLSLRSPRRLLHCSIHGSPTPRPTFPRRSPLARRDRARHPRFTALHRAAPARRSTLLDRNRFRTR